MSEFQVPIVELEIAPHPNADRLEIATVGGYKCVVKKGQFHTGEAHVYIPEASIVPAPLLEDLGLTGMLAGPQKNRVKAVRLRGVLSQGLVCPIKIAQKHGLTDFNEGFDASDQLGITKYEPVLPAQLAGNVWNAGTHRTLRYDIENIKNRKYRDILQEGEEVVFTEKLHGTWCMAALMPHNMEHPEQGRIVVSSKGQAAKGLAIKVPVPPAPQNWNQRLRERYWKAHAKIRSFWHMIRYDLVVKSDPDFLCDLHSNAAAFYARRIKACYNKGVNENNVYWRAVTENKVLRDVVYLDQVIEDFSWVNTPIFVLGEVFGSGIQDLDYGSTSNKPGFRVFDIYIGAPGAGRYLNDDELTRACNRLGLKRVPVLYRGPFSMEKVAEYTSGNESVTGASKHIREGIVIRPITERHDNTLGRVQLKSVSDEYLTRKGGTEFN